MDVAPSYDGVGAFWGGGQVKNKGGGLIFNYFWRGREEVGTNAFLAFSILGWGPAFSQKQRACLEGLIWGNLFLAPQIGGKFCKKKSLVN